MNGEAHKIRLSDVVYRLMDEQRLNGVELAKKTGLSTAYISKMLNGRIEKVSLITVRNLAKGFGITLGDLLERLKLLQEPRETDAMMLIRHALRKEGLSSGLAEELLTYARTREQSKK